MVHFVRLDNTISFLFRKCHEVKVLGLDCEWITSDSGRKPVALLQLATSDGFCSLFQLCHFDKIPTELFVRIVIYLFLNWYLFT